MEEKEKGGERAEVWKVAVEREQVEGWKMRGWKRERRREGEAGSTQQDHVTFFFSSYQNHLPGLSCPQHRTIRRELVSVSPACIICIYLLYLPQKQTSNPSNIPAINPTAITSPLSKSRRQAGEITVDQLPDVKESLNQAFKRYCSYPGFRIVNFWSRVDLAPKFIQAQIY